MSTGREKALGVQAMVVVDMGVPDVHQMSTIEWSMSTTRRPRSWFAGTRRLEVAPDAVLTERSTFTRPDSRWR